MAVKVIDLEPKPFLEALQSWLPGVSSISSLTTAMFLPSQTTHSQASGWQVKRARAGAAGAAGAATADGAADTAGSGARLGRSAVSPLLAQHLVACEGQATEQEHAEADEQRQREPFLGTPASGSSAD